MADKGKKKQSHSHLKRFGMAVTIALICIGLAYLMGLIPFFERAELMSLDIRYRTRKPIELYHNLGYVNLDNESCELAGAWPWPRTYHNALIKTLKFYDATSAGYDVFYTEKSPLDKRPHPELEELSQDERYEFIESMIRVHDNEFEEGLLESEIIYLGQFMTTPDQVLTLANDASLEEIHNFIKKEKETAMAKDEQAVLDKEEALAIADRDSFPSNELWNQNLDHAFDIAVPITQLAQASKGIGFEQIIPDNITGTVYQYPIFLEYNGRIYPALGLLIAADILGIDLSKTKLVPGEYIEFEVTKAHGKIQPGPVRIPINEKTRLLMNWSAPYFDTYFHVNFKQLSYYYAYNQIKQILQTIPAEDFGSKNIKRVYKNLKTLIISENWVPEDDAGPIAMELILAHGIQIKQSKENLLKLVHSTEGFSEKDWDRVSQAVTLAMKVRDQANQDDLEYAKNNFDNHDYWTFREGLYSEKDYPALSSEHQSEIARNVLAFKAKGRLKEVSPLYFPPCLEARIQGKDRALSPIMLHNKVLMIGLEGEGTIDLNPQPYEESCAMVALHANAINMFLTGQYLSFKDPMETLFYLVVLTFLVSIISQYVGTRLRLPLILILFTGFIWQAWHKFSEKGEHLAVVIPALGMGLAYLISLGIQLYVAYKEKQKMKGMFGKMVSPDVLKVMSDNPELFSLTGKRQPCTSYFSSMENFKEITKGVTPQEMTGLLSSYLTPASQIVTGYKGYIDKYEGHIIMADFGVPLNTGDHRLQCLYSCIEQQLDIQAFKTFIYSRTGKHVNTSMGVNTGFVSAGNMGSDKKMQYTIMGDTVNTAARFRPANWIYDYLGSIIIGEMTYPLVKDHIESRNLDRLLLKGKLKPVNIYEVMGWNESSYTEMRGKEDVSETLMVCWAQHCPPEKIYGYEKFWKYQHQRKEHPLCLELSDFFAGQIDASAELTRLTIFKQIRDNGVNYLELSERYQAITQKPLAPIPEGQWQPRLQQWAQELHGSIEVLEKEYRGNPEADKLHRDLLDVYEKLEAMEERLELNSQDLELPEPLIKTWDEIRDYMSSGFIQDDKDYHELYMQRYSQYEEKATELVNHVKGKMGTYHEMMAQIGSRTEAETRGATIYEEGLQLHWERKWDESMAKFKAALEFLPGDKASLTFIDRLESYKVNPPGSDWQGEFKQTKK